MGRQRGAARTHKTCRCPRPLACRPTAMHPCTSQPSSSPPRTWPGVCQRALGPLALVLRGLREERGRGEGEGWTRSRGGACNIGESCGGTGQVHVCMPSSSSSAFPPLPYRHIPQLRVAVQCPAVVRAHHAGVTGAAHVVLQLRTKWKRGNGKAAVARRLTFPFLSPPSPSLPLPSLPLPSSPLPPLPLPTFSPAQL